MSDETTIRPALRPDEWSWADSDEARGYVARACGEVFTPWDTVSRHGMIALANHQLAAADPQKITADAVAELRLIAAKYQQLLPLVLALESYMPPKQP